MNVSQKSVSKLMATPKKSETNVKPDSKPTASKTLHRQCPPPSDPYVTFKDAIWKDVVIHERKLDTVWNSTWKSFLFLPNDYQKPESASRSNIKVYDTNAEKIISPGTPRKKLLYAKSSDIYGSFGVDDLVLQKQQAMAERPVVSRIRFVPEQYGHYRKMKYVKDKDAILANIKKENSTMLPSSKIKHKVNPLLC